MTSEQKAALLAYVTTIAGILGVGYWELEVEAQPANTEAATWLADNEDKATIHVAKDFFTKDAAYQRRLIAHEILHVCLNRGVSALHAVVDGLAMKGYRDALIEPADQLYERSVESLARAISPGLPLPHFPPDDPS